MGLNEHELETTLQILANQAQLVSVDKGDVICRMDEPARDFFLIYQGFVEIETSTQTLCRGQGAFFGEFPAVGLAQDLQRPLPYVLSARAREADYEDRMPRRSGSITALDSVELFRFPLVPFIDFLLMPDHSTILQKLATRLQQMTQS